MFEFLSSDAIFDATLLPAMMVALAAGFLSFLSPCVLPVVPPYLAYMGGVTVTDMDEDAAARRRAFVSAAFFVLGLSTVFLILGFSFSFAGRFFLTYQGWFNTIAGLTIMVFGFHFLGLYRIGFLDQEARIDAGDRGGSSFGAYILGLAFAFGWTPCLGPILGTILSLAAQEASVTRGTTLLATYALGLGIPFLLVAAFFPRLGGFMRFMKRNTFVIEKVSGVLLLVVGLMMVTGIFAEFAYYLLETFPSLAAFG